MGIASKIARKIKPRSKKTTMKSPDAKENELIHKERKIAQRVMGAGEGYFARSSKRGESTKAYGSRLNKMDFALDLMEEKMSASNVKEILEIHNSLTIGDRRKNIREAVRQAKAYGEKNPGKNISKKILNNAGVKIENGKVVIK